MDSRNTDKPTIYVVDPGRVGLLGHQFALNRMIGDYATGKGYRVRYLVDAQSGKDLVEALDAMPVLDFNIYAPIPTNIEQAKQAISRANADAYRALSENIPELLPGDRLVMHTVNHLGLAGMAEWAAENAPDSFSARIIFRFPANFAPDYTPVDEFVSVYCESALIRGLNAWRFLPFEVAMFGDSPELVDHIKDLTGWELPRLPTSIPFSKCTPVRSENSDRPPVFLFAGNGRKEKGILILAEAIRKYKAQGGAGRFIVQSITNPEIAKSFAGLEDVVDIPNRHMEGAAYFSFLSKADAIIVPYDPQKYERRTSHVLIEGLGVGRPVITMSGTWMQQEAERISPGSSLFMTGYNADKLLECLRDFEKRRAELTDLAWRQSANVREIHSEDRFLSEYIGI